MYKYVGIFKSTYIPIKWHIQFHLHVFIIIAKVLQFIVVGNNFDWHLRTIYFYLMIFCITNTQPAVINRFLIVGQQSIVSIDTFYSYYKVIQSSCCKNWTGY